MDNFFVFIVWNFYCLLIADDGGDKEEVRLDPGSGLKRSFCVFPVDFTELVIMSAYVKSGHMS